MKVHKWMDEIKAVSGYNRAVLYDLNRQDFLFVPVEINALIDKLEGKQLPDLSEDEAEWLQRLLDNEYIFQVSSELFPYFKSADMKWNHPAFIINAIFHDSEYLGKCIRLVDDLICKYALILAENLERVEQIMNDHFMQSNFHKVDFQLRLNFDESELKQLLDKFPNLGSVTIAEGPIEAGARIAPISERYFREAQEYNTYFNRKLYVDEGGNLKNAPGCDESFGNISYIHTSEQLKEVISTPSFQKYWHVSRDKISVCRDCELRYMCFDTRLPKQRKSGDWYFESECDYNPYISKWNDKDDYKNLSECGVINNEDEFRIDHDHVAKLQLELWDR